MDKEQVLLKKQKIVRAGGIILGVDSIILLIGRVLAYFLSGAFPSLSEAHAELALEAIFDTVVQIGSLAFILFIVGKLYLKTSAKEYCALANIRKVDWKVCALAVAVGIFSPALSGLINVFVNTVLQSMGCKMPSSASVYPEQFEWWVFLINIVLVSVFPAICEENVNRGIALTALRNMFPEWATILLGGLVFGLFHQYIYQTFYTAAFGMILVYVALKTESIVPCMIIHFTNNFFAVIADFADFYGWAPLSLTGIIVSISENAFVTIALLVLAIIIEFLLIFALVKTHKKIKAKQLARELNIETPSSVSISVEVLGGQLSDPVYYKPTIKDTVGYIVALVISALTTVSSFFFALL